MADRERRLVREVLTAKDVRFEISFAVGEVPPCVLVRVRGKDRLKAEAALDLVVDAVAARFAKLEVVRTYDPDAGDWRHVGSKNPAPGSDAAGVIEGPATIAGPSAVRRPG